MLVLKISEVKNDRTATPCVLGGGCWRQQNSHFAGRYLLKVVAFVVVVARWYCLSFLIELESYEVLMTGLPMVVAVSSAAGNEAGDCVSFRNIWVGKASFAFNICGFWSDFGL